MDFGCWVLSRGKGVDSVGFVYSSVSDTVFSSVGGFAGFHIC